MEEEWDLVKSLSSSLNLPEHIEKSTSVELNFNRFANQPEFHIEDDDYPEDYDQQLMDEGVIFSDSSIHEEGDKEDDPLSDNSIDEINFTLGDSKIMNEDTISDDIQNNSNNKLEQQRINQYKNSIIASFFPINNFFMENKDQSTRESEVDKQSLWKNASAGPSVPYISPPMHQNELVEDWNQPSDLNEPAESDTQFLPRPDSRNSSEGSIDDKDVVWYPQNTVSDWHATEAGPSSDPSNPPSEKRRFFSSNFSFGFGEKDMRYLRDRKEEVARSLMNLQLEFEQKRAEQQLKNAEKSQEDSPRPTKQTRSKLSNEKRPQLTSEPLPSFGASPKQTSPTLSTHSLTPQESPTNSAHQSTMNPTHQSSIKLTQQSPILPTHLPPNPSNREIPSLSTRQLDTHTNTQSQLHSPITPNRPLPTLSTHRLDSHTNKQSQVNPPIRPSPLLSTRQLDSHTNQQSQENFSSVSNRPLPTLSTHQLDSHTIQSPTAPSPLSPSVSFPGIPIAEFVKLPNIELERREEETEEIVDRLLRCFQTYTGVIGQITGIYLDIQAIQPDPRQWCNIKVLNLSRQNLIGLHNLDGSLPSLETLDISHNELKSISGLPASLCTLFASHNRLVEIDVYHLSQLQHLDVSHNLLCNFDDLSPLKSLRSLNASYNNIDSFDYFGNLTGLINLSLKANSIRRISEFHSEFEVFQLETLDISFNRIEYLESIDKLTRLRELNANHNGIKSIHLSPMPKLCKLKLSFNRLKTFDVLQFPDIRTLYLDDNQIESIVGMERVSRIDSFSMRDQGREEVDYNLHYFRGARKLYLSGSLFTNIYQMRDFYTLETLEICASGLHELPSDFGKMVPNLVNLYLSMNRLDNIRPLKKLKYLQRLVLIDNRLISVNDVISVVKHLRSLTVLDLRQNPICKNIYPALDLKLTQLSGEKDKISLYITTAHDVSWEGIEIAFRENLDSHWKRRREIYRAYMIHESPGLIELDHIPVTSREQSQCHHVINNFQRLRLSSNSRYYK